MADRRRDPTTGTVLDLAAGDRAVLGHPRVTGPQLIRLAELGLRAGEHITMTQRAVGGARVLSVNGSRIAVDARTAGALVLAAWDVA